MCLKTVGLLAIRNTYILLHQKGLRAQLLEF